MKLRTILLGLSALSIAGAAAFFSVTGLSKLFAGAALAVTIMAGTLEFGKLITASFLHEHWGKINTLLKTYLTIGVVVLVLITSMGIYGFLTAAYQKTADELTKIDRQVEVIELKKSRYQEQLDSFIDERNNLSLSITELTKGLSNNVIQYTDTTGRLITTTSSSTRRVLNDQLDDSKEQRDRISLRIEALTDSVTKLEISILDIEGSSELAAEVGPLKYMSEISGLPMSSVVNIFALMIVFVFDPLAISLVLAFNTSLKIDRGETDKKKVVEKRELYGEESQLWDNTLQDGLEDDEWDEDDDKLQSEIAENSYEDYRVELSDEQEKILSDIIEESNDVRDIIEYDEADLNQDGIVSEEEKREWYENRGGWRDGYNGQPYYMHPWFDWGKRERWINNRKAIDYWLNYRGGSRKALKEIKSDYPTDFESKTY
jgi:hypothetical protein